MVIIDECSMIPYMIINNIYDDIYDDGPHADINTAFTNTIIPRIHNLDADVTMFNTTQTVHIRKSWFVNFSDK